jgi:hypothetical protein
MYELIVKKKTLLMNLYFIKLESLQINVPQLSISDYSGI